MPTAWLAHQRLITIKQRHPRQPVAVGGNVAGQQRVNQRVGELAGPHSATAPVRMRVQCRDTAQAETAQAQRGGGDRINAQAVNATPPTPPNGRARVRRATASAPGPSP